MHKCSKCGRAASSLEEIDAGCPCGSKVFVFDRQIAQALVIEGNDGAAGKNEGMPDTFSGNGGAKSAVGAGGNGGGAITANAIAEGNNGAGNGGNGNPAVANIGAVSTFAVPGTAKDKPQETTDEQEGKVPSAYYARTSFTGDDIENIKVLTQGVFLLDVNAISKNPVVLKDEDEIYYVKLPLVQKKAQQNEKENEGNEKK